MLDFFKGLKFKLILCFIALLIGVMLYSVTQNGYSSGGSKIISTVSRPFRYISSAVSDNLGSTFDHVFNSKKYYNENQDLKEEISDLRNDLIGYEDTKKELEELRKFVGIKENNENFELSPPCRIIAYTANDPFCSFIIDKGTQDGISLHDPVVTADGLVGSVSEVSDKFSTVQTILSPDLSVSITAVGKPDRAVLEGDIEYSKDGMTKIIYIEKDSKLTSGDTIITTGSSGLFPAEYLIGKITKTGNSQNGLSNYAVLEPFVDIRKLTSVMVITSFEGKGETDEYQTNID